VQSQGDPSGDIDIYTSGNVETDFHGDVWFRPSRINSWEEVIFIFNSEEFATLTLGLESAGAYTTYYKDIIIKEYDHESLVLSDGTTEILTPLTYGQHQIGIAYSTSEAKMKLNMDGNWETEVAYDGDFGDGEISTEENIRRLQRKLEPYQDAQDRIDGLMPKDLASYLVDEYENYLTDGEGTELIAPAAPVKTAPQDKSASTRFFENYSDAGEIKKIIVDGSAEIADNQQLITKEYFESEVDEIDGGDASGN
jgi:hypothetical protein